MSGKVIKNIQKIMEGQKHAIKYTIHLEWITPQTPAPLSYPLRTRPCIDHTCPASECKVSIAALI
jgi:hypothetical protein